jgi:hypothetical protein
MGRDIVFKQGVIGEGQLRNDSLRVRDIAPDRLDEISRPDRGRMPDQHTDCYCQASLSDPSLLATFLGQLLEPMSAPLFGLGKPAKLCHLPLQA